MNTYIFMCIAVKAHGCHMYVDAWPITKLEPILVYIWYIIIIGFSDLLDGCLNMSCGKAGKW